MILMDAKYIRDEVIKNIIKPAFKNNNYKINGNTFIKEEKGFYKVITIQNFSWNNANEVEFCLNIGILLMHTTKCHELTGAYSANKCHIQVRESFFLPSNRKKGEFHERGQYLIKKGAEEEKLKSIIKKDIDEFILFELDKINTIDDCIERFGGLGNLSYALNLGLEEIKNKKE
jgi:hypothetical protein